ncbi:GntR family transcriptional regulator [Emticicia sp. TH156]|uniref:GntR family transcriptional regulator n=1 Tax=Emticicia sp. TH156 TaxID=2067454 RepID=UPI000C759DAA|nr:GntR family transcriptional regulator [Emticicia sp. TH156]PLK46236.1 GntR family transcriptional regulator [Emticicia sp. TH156]
MYKLQLNPNDKTPKYKQIVRSVIADIERTVLKKNEQLPSISELSEEYYLARDTVEKAYRELKELGYITAVQGKGFYVNGKEHSKMRILLIFNKLSSYKKLIYYAFLRALGNKATVDLQIHHYNTRIFEEIIEKNLGKYNYYVVMPHFFPEADKALALKTLEKIPADELVFLDKDLPEYPHPILSVYQDFENDVFDALDSANDLLAKYERLVLVFPSDGNYPREIVKGFRFFCINSGKEFSIKENAIDEIPKPKTAYVVVEETDLADLIKKTRQTNYQLGQDIGLVSFNDTTLKELLEITVITTDFETMGRTAAALLLDKKQIKVKNPFYIIRRQSL